MKVTVRENPDYFKMDSYFGVGTNERSHIIFVCI